jgi:uncharacterized protein YegL
MDINNNNNNNNNNAVDEKPQKSVDIDIKQQQITISCSPEKEALSYDTTHDVMVLSSLKGPFMENAARASRAPIDLVAVIDKSGSMEGDKINLVLQTMKFVVEQLKDEDQLCIVTYDTRVTLDFPFEAMDAKGKTKAQEKIAKVAAGSCTNLSGGLLKGIQEIINRKKKNDVASLLLFTDGLANEGITKSHQIVNAVEKTLVTVDSACTIFTFGYGKDHDESMLRAISDCGKGMYYFIETLDDIAECFGDCLGGLLSVVAQNLTLTMECAKGITIKKVLSQVRNGDKLSGDKIDIQLGDLYSEEERDIIVMATLPALKDPHDDPLPVMDITLTYFNVITSSFEKRGITAYVKRPGSTPPNQQCNLALDKQRNRILAADSMEQAKQLGDKGDLNQARAKIQGAIDSIQTSPSHDEQFCKNLVKDLQESLAELQDHSNYDIASKKMYSKAASHSKQRAWGKGGFYQNSAKVDYQAKSKAFSARPPQPSSSSSSTTSNAPNLNANVTQKKLIVGNTHSVLPESEATPSVYMPGEKCYNLWKMYVKIEGEDVGEYVEKVVYHLHPTFQPNLVTVTTPPFELERKGWGYFEVGVDIYFKPKFGKDMMAVKHTLCFEHGGAETGINVDFPVV